MAAAAGVRRRWSRHPAGQSSYDCPMCTNFRPPERLDLAELFDFPPPAFDYPEETYPGYPAPVVRRALSGQYESMRGVFGLIPFWARDATIGRRTYNARSETVAGKPAFRGAWKHSQRALVPMIRFYEPDWSSGRAVRWRIERRDRSPFAVAALWERWDDRAREEVVESFTLLTINADGHPVMGRFHRPGDEKRSLVPVAREDWAAWLDDDPESAARLLLPMRPERFTASADPLPKRQAGARQAGPRPAGARQAGTARATRAAAQAPLDLFTPADDTSDETPADGGARRSRA